MPIDRFVAGLGSSVSRVLHATGSQPLAVYARSRDNNFNLIRLLAASIVIVSHSYALAGSAGREPLVRLAQNLSLGDLAVDIFFIISGFLVTKSFLNRTSLSGFISARVLRIYPGLVVAILCNVFVFGLAWTTLPKLAYLTSRETWTYLLVDATLPALGIGLRYVLPGVFQSNVWGPAVNGSLWTLPFEVWIYIGLLAVGLLGVLKRRRAANALVALVVVLATGYSLHVFSGPLFAWPYLPYFLRFASFFACGIFFFVNRSVIPLNGLLAAGLLALTVLTWRTPVTPPLIFPFSLAYLIFWLGFVPGGFVRRYNTLGDYSYGVYIYAFPVQQSFIALLPGIKPLLLTSLAFPVTLGLAILSWHFIEHPSLQLKKSIRSRRPAQVLSGPEV